MRRTHASSSELQVIVMDGRKIGFQPTGVGHYTDQLLRGMNRLTDVESIGLGARWYRRGIPWHLRTALRVISDPNAVYFSPESLIVPTLVGARAAVTVHDITPMTHPARHTRRNRAFHALFLRISLRRVGAIITPTRAVASQLAEMLPSISRKISTIPEGVRLASATSTTPREKTVLYVGTIEPRKNIPCLISAFLQSELEGWRLVLVGKRGWLSEYEHKQLDELTNSPSIVELGYLDDNELKKHYACASVFAYISEAEGFGLPPLEAMASGLPVVVSNDPALTEVVGGAGIIIKLGASQQQDLSAALSKLALSSGLRERMGIASLARSKVFSWDSASHDTLTILQQLGAK